MKHNTLQEDKMLHAAIPAEKSEERKVNSCELLEGVDERIDI